MIRYLNLDFCGTHHRGNVGRLRRRAMISSTVRRRRGAGRPWYAVMVNPITYYALGRALGTEG